MIYSIGSPCLVNCRVDVHMQSLGGRHISCPFLNALKNMLKLCVLVPKQCSVSLGIACRIVCQTWILVLQLHNRIACYNCMFELDERIGCQICMLELDVRIGCQIWMLELHFIIACQNCMLENWNLDVVIGCSNCMLKKQLGHVQVLAPWSSAMISDLLTRS